LQFENLPLKFKGLLNIPWLLDTTNRSPILYNPNLIYPISNLRLIAIVSQSQQQQSFLELKSILLDTTIRSPILLYGSPFSRKIYQQNYFKCLYTVPKTEHPYDENKLLLLYDCKNYKIIFILIWLSTNLSAVDGARWKTRHRDAIKYKNCTSEALTLLNCLLFVNDLQMLSTNTYMLIN